VWLLVLGAVALLGGVRPAFAEASMARTPRFVEAWSEPGVSLEARVENTRTAALELGLRNVEPAARALLASPPEGTRRVETARMAVRLAPDLPAAHMALAVASLTDDFAPIGAARATLDAVAAFRRNLEASLWLYAASFHAAAMALAGGAILYLVLSALWVTREAAHDLGDRLAADTPRPSRAALLGVVMLAPAAAGQGILGLCLACLVIAAAYGTRRSWVAAGLAALALTVALHPMLQQAGKALGAFHSDPVALSVHNAQHGFATPVHLARLERAAESDPLAARALAMGVKRTGDLQAADARYAALLVETPDDPVLLNNAANVRLALGDTDGAIGLYRHALQRRPSAVTWFNLSQAWGAALNVVELDAALATAQQLDSELVEDLSLIQERAIHFVADLAVEPSLLRARALAASDGGPVADALRRPLAPGLLGATPLATGAVLAGALALGVALHGRFRPSRGCQRCGSLVCPRCDHASIQRGLCETCNRLLYKTEGTDPALRAARAEQLARRASWVDRLSLAASLAVPGAVAMLGGRPVLAFFTCVAASATVVSFAARHGPAPDPLAAGAAGPALFLAASLAFAALYALLVVLGLSARTAR
jgi:tetratricopeptide (TPR) repeat protein